MKNRIIDPGICSAIALGLGIGLSMGGGVLASLPPVVSSVTANSGSVLGGTPITLTGSNFTGVTSVTIGGSACTSVVVVSDISITCVTPAKAKGSYDVVATSPAGSGTLTNGYTFAVLDPSTLALSGWFRGSYTGLPWAGTASAGTSGAKSQTNFGAPFAVGPSQNGFTPARGLGGSTDSVANVGGYITRTAYRVVILTNVGANAAYSGAANTDAALISDSVDLEWGITVNDTNVQLYHYDSAFRVALKPLSTGWHMIDASFDGSTLSISVDAGTPATQAATTLANVLGDPLQIGHGFAYYAGDIMEVITSKVTLATTSAAEFKAYFNDRYALTL